MQQSLGCSVVLPFKAADTWYAGLFCRQRVSAALMLAFFAPFWAAALMPSGVLMASTQTRHYQDSHSFLMTACSLDTPG